MTTPRTTSTRKVQAVIHVSPSGDDGNPGTADAPFLTLPRARQAVRAINADMTGDIVVQLRGGRYLLDKPFVLEPPDSGSNGFAVVYASAPGERAIFDGGLRITGWRKGEHGTWEAPVDLEELRQLYINGRRVIRSMMFGQLLGHLELLENGSGYRTTSEIASWMVGAKGVEFVYRWTWNHTRLRVDEVRNMGSHYEIIMKQPEFFLARNKEGTQVLDPLFMENFPPFPPAMQLNGVWYFDPAKKVVSYFPEVDEDMTQCEVVAPRLEKLLELRGQPVDPVHDIHFENVGFEHATWLEPSRTGMVEVQANMRLTAETKLHVRPNAPTRGKVFLSARTHECVKSPANVVCHAGHRVSFDGCHFARLGGAGLDIERGSNGVRVSRCEFADISGSGIQVADVQQDDHHPDDPCLGVQDVEISGCNVHHAAAEFHGGVGVFVGYARNVRIVDNEIHHLPYSGISVGWGWGELDPREKSHFGTTPGGVRFTEPAWSGGHAIERNHIHDVVREMDDGGAIYTLGRMPASRICDNVIEDSRGWSGGIYLDAGSEGITVERNALSRVISPVVVATDCLLHCQVRNNTNQPPALAFEAP
ncbi:MAG: right-handed parallel beta-helix repeat-containing protein [Phycisphaeraceae bacterium]|nr:right-handed parallel beta-helix repeat-containing protein [Phycisphaeraceae bacterium]